MVLDGSCRCQAWETFASVYHLAARMIFFGFAQVPRRDRIDGVEQRRTCECPNWDSTSEMSLSIAGVKLSELAWSYHNIFGLIIYPMGKLNYKITDEASLMFIKIHQSGLCGDKIL